MHLLFQKSQQSSTVGLHLQEKRFVFSHRQPLPVRQLSFVLGPQFPTGRIAQGMLTKIVSYERKQRNYSRLSPGATKNTSSPVQDELVPVSNAA
jgi:hypothetical protein